MYYAVYFILTCFRFATYFWIVKYNVRLAKFLHYLSYCHLHLTEKTEAKRQPVQCLMFWKLVVDLSISHIWPFLRRHLVSVLARSHLSWLMFTVLLWSICWNNSEQHLPVNWAMEGFISGYNLGWGSDCPGCSYVVSVCYLYVNPNIKPSCLDLCWFDTSRIR